jgi:hypothetical protein
MSKTAFLESGVWNSGQAIWSQRKIITITFSSIIHAFLKFYKGRSVVHCETPKQEKVTTKQHSALEATVSYNTGEVQVLTCLKNNSERDSSVSLGYKADDRWIGMWYNTGAKIIFLSIMSSPALGPTLSFTVFVSMQQSLSRIVKVAHTITEFPKIYEERSFSNVFTATLHRFRPWTIRIQFLFCYPTSIKHVFNVILSFTPNYSKCYLFFVIPPNHACNCDHLHMCYMSHQSHPLWYAHPNTSRRGLQAMKFLIM